MKKKIAVLGAGIYNMRVFEKLREGQFYSIAIDGNSEAPAAKYADEFVHLNFTDKEALLNHFRAHPVDAVLAINEWGIEPTAYVNRHLGLRGISEETALMATDKGYMRDAWKKAGLPIPSYFVFSNFEELQNGAKSLGYPCVIKPTFSGGGGRGISVLKSEEDLKWAFEFAEKHVKNNRFICESFAEGTELTIETISVEGEVYILAISDKYKPDLRTRVSTSINYPARLSAEQEALVHNVVKKAVLALGISNGMAHTEAIIQDMEFHLVETGARGGGSHIFPLIIEAVSGINAPVVAAQLLTGTKPNISTILKRGVVYRFLNPEHGILRGVNNLQEVRNWPGILEVGMGKKVGDEVGNLFDSLQRAGFLIATGESREAAFELADKAEAQIELVVESLSGA